MRIRTCKECKKKFQPTRAFQPCCNNECNFEYAMKQLRKKQQERQKLHNVKKREFKNNDKAHLLKTAQAKVNKYVRLRDKDLPCISCGYCGTSRQWHAGHFKPVGSNSQIRFDENNIHKQCSICNNYLSGNLIKYRENLVKKVGEEIVLKLERKEIKKWEVDELKEIIKTFDGKIKELKEAA